MFRHPTVIAAIILSVGMFISSALICVFIDSLDTTLKRMPVGAIPPSAFPDHLTLGNGNSDFKVLITQPLVVKQVP